MLCALCALGFKKDGKVWKLERYIIQRSIPVWVLTSRHTEYEQDISATAPGFLPRVMSCVTLLGTLLEHLIISKPLDGSDSYMVC